MYRDPRGGHNQKNFNENFFKKWSSQMAYILGFIAADGALIDARKSSRTCYTTLSSNDKELLESIKLYMNSSHPISSRPAHFNKFRNGTFFCKESFILRFGSKTMFQDLINLGITPRKSLRIKLPKIPEKYFHLFLRGNFDGDGCINIYTRKRDGLVIPQVIFTSGSKKFLTALGQTLSNYIKIYSYSVTWDSGAYRLRYKKKASVNIVKYMYRNLKTAPYLERKYLKALPYL